MKNGNMVKNSVALIGINIQMRKFLVILLLFFSVHGASGVDTKFPYPDMNIIHVYQLDNGKMIYIEQTAVGSTIWEKNKTAKELKLVKHIWYFIGIAKSCPDRNLTNILFATNKEYYYMGGINETPPIRMYELDNLKGSIGMAPDLKYVKQWCTFYKPIH